MKLKKWTEQVQDRLKWKGIVEKAKTVPELQRQARRRRHNLERFRVQISAGLR